MIVSNGEELRKKKKRLVVNLSFLDDADAVALKAHKALSVEDLCPLMAKSSSKAMSPHIHKLVQVGCF